MDRRTFLALSGQLGVVAAASGFAPRALAQAFDRNAIANDPTAPAAGNPKGDITVAAFFDYCCPYCKMAELALDNLAETDGRIRLVYKDWPILTETSAYGAMMALGARYQGKYAAAHAALMGIPGARIPQSRMRETIKAAGVDMDRLEADLKTHDRDITALLKHNAAQAEALALEGTPAFLVGPLLVRSALDYDGFKLAVAQARAQMAKR